jgi:outer membrane protein assembly factor BamA
MKTVAEKQLLLVYRDHGFLQAKIEQLKPLMENSEVTVEVSLSEGDQFKLGGCQWSGNTLMSAADLNKFIHLKPGEPVNLSTLEEDLASARKALGKFGREAATIQPEPTYSAGAVSYIFQVHEGEVYRMGNFELEGVAPELSAKLAESWKLAPGATYDNTYVNQFFRNVATRLPGKHWEWLTFEQVDSANKVVNVRLELSTK